MNERTASVPVPDGAASVGTAATDCGHPNHGAEGHDCRQWVAAMTTALLDSMSTDELADELAERARDGYDEDGLWDTLRHLAGKANGLADA